MQQFTVPQFIDVEDKIIGPVTTRQFVIMMVAFIIIAIEYKTLDFTGFVFFGLLTFGISGIIAFLKVNGRPFHFFILNIVQTMKRPALRVWRKSIENFEAIEIDIHKAVQEKGVKVDIGPKTYTKSRLAELSLIVDTKGLYRGERSADDMDINR